MQHLFDLTKQLMRFRTVAGNTSEIQKCIDFVKAFFAGTNLHVEHIISNDIHSLVITKNNNIHPKVFFCGHLDVVDARDEQFVPQEDEEKIYGRGSMDMKSGNAVMMSLMKELAETDHDVGLMLTGDEEIGGFDGVKHLLEQGYGCEVVVIPDGGQAVHNIVNKEKGIIQLRIEANGKNAHGSQPWNGDCAISLLMENLYKIKELFLPHEEHPEDRWVTTFNIGKIEGGRATNQVSESAVAYCDIRYTEETTSTEILEKVKGVISPGIAIEALLNEPMVITDPDNLYVQAFWKAVEAVGRQPQYALDHGASDGRFFSARAIPVLISQPDGYGLHGPEEWVSKQGMIDYYQALKNFVDAVALEKNET